MDREPCLDEELLASLALGAGRDSSFEPARRHLADCCACRGKAVWAAAVLEEDRAPAGRPRRRGLFGGPARAAAAAAVLLCAGTAGVAWRFRTTAEPVPAGARRLGTLTAAVEAAGGRAFLLPDGSVVRVAPGGRARFHPPRRGERCRLELLEGDLDVEAARRDGLFRVAAPGGEIQVVGTRFRAKAFRLHIDPSRPLDCLSVVVFEGKVRLRNAQGDIPTGAGERGIALDGEPPVLQDAVGSPAEIAASFAQNLEWDGADVRVAAGRERNARLLAATFWASPAAAAWTESGEGLSPRQREALGLLARWGSAGGME